MIARMLGAAARAESEQKAERVSRARQQAAESGRANGLLGFGYRSDQSIDPGQAATVLEISSRILAGETLYRIASDLNGRGVRAPGGGEWRSANLRQMVTRASLSGWREWSAGKRTASRGDRRTGNRWGEFTALGIWDPILSRETVEQLRELFANPGRRVVGRPVYALLTGVARCGKCGAPMTSAPGTVGRRYRCNSQPGMTRCGGVSILSEPVDILVTEALLDRLSLSRIPEKVNRGPQGAREPLLSELEQAKRKRDDIATLYATDQLTQSEWVSARRAVTIRIEEAEHALRSAGISPNPALKNLPEGGPKLRGWWAAADTQQRSAVVKAVIERVDIAPGRPGANRFDPARVGYPVWRS
jgi:site-specific DNA recombinase